jgi:hypothetical protein
VRLVARAPHANPRARTAAASSVASLDAFTEIVAGGQPVATR